jgi:hypothetical protein
VQYVFAPAAKTPRRILRYKLPMPDRSLRVKTLTRQQIHTCHRHACHCVPPDLRSDEHCGGVRRSNELPSLCCGVCDNCYHDLLLVPEEEDGQEDTVTCKQQIISNDIIRSICISNCKKFRKTAHGHEHL